MNEEKKDQRIQVVLSEGDMVQLDRLQRLLDSKNRSTTIREVVSLMLGENEHFKLDGKIVEVGERNLYGGLKKEYRNMLEDIKRELMETTKQLLNAYEEDDLKVLKLRASLLRASLSDIVNLRKEDEQLNGLFNSSFEYKKAYDTMELRLKAGRLELDKLNSKKNTDKMLLTEGK